MMTKKGKYTHFFSGASAELPRAYAAHHPLFFETARSITFSCVCARGSFSQRVRGECNKCVVVGCDGAGREGKKRRRPPTVTKQCAVVVVGCALAHGDGAAASSHSPMLRDLMCPGPAGRLLCSRVCVVVQRPPRLRRPSAGPVHHPQRSHRRAGQRGRWAAVDCGQQISGNGGWVGCRLRLGPQHTNSTPSSHLYRCPLPPTLPQSTARGCCCGQWRTWLPPTLPAMPWIS